MEESIRKTNASMCYSCGRCTAHCPVVRAGASETPRQMIERGIHGRELTDDELMWNCLTCKLCQNFCPEDVDFVGFIRKMRGIARKKGGSPDYSHGEMMQTIGRIIASGKFKQRKLGWLDKSKVLSESKTALWVGCSPFLDTVLREYGSDQLRITMSAIEILNSLGLKPRIFEEEVCCGHDQFWIGEVETFRELMRKNVEMLESSNIERLVFTCPEGYEVMVHSYPDLDIELAHISEVVSNLVDQGKVSFRQMEMTVTYQDPCRLGRFLGVYDEPRKVLEQIDGIELVEMEHSRTRSRCCGVSAWINCNQNSKRMQLERVEEAVDTAPIMVTNCPKCLTHFRCVGKEDGFNKDIEFIDWTVLVSQAMRGV